MLPMLPWFTESTADRLVDVRDTSRSKLVRDNLLALVVQAIHERDALRCEALMSHHVGGAYARLPDALPPSLPAAAPAILA